MKRLFQDVFARVKRPGSRPCSTGTIAAALLLFGTPAPGPARAGSFSVTGLVEAGTVSESRSASTGGAVQELSATIGPVQANNNSGLGPDLARALATISLGRVTAFASATSVDGTGVLGTAAGQWVDTFTATTSDPSVTQVTFRTTLSLEDTIHGSGRVSEGNAIAAVAPVSATANLRGFSLEDAFGNPIVARTMVETFTEPVGVPFVLTGTLSLIASIDGPSVGSVTVDVDHTALLNLDALTPGGGYTTASGVSYASVPEPSSLTLLGLGALGLLVAGRRWCCCNGSA